MSALTDEVATLRAILARQASGLHRNGILARVDRIAAGVQELSTPVTRPDDVAELREKIDFNAYRSDEAREIGDLIDRIAARPAPQQATDAHGTVYRMHMPCRRVMIESRSACRYCDEVGAWRTLYTLGGA